MHHAARFVATAETQPGCRNLFTSGRAQAVTFVLPTRMSGRQLIEQRASVNTLRRTCDGYELPGSRFARAFFMGDASMGSWDEMRQVAIVAGMLVAVLAGMVLLLVAGIVGMLGWMVWG